MTPATATRFAVLSAALVEGRTFASVEAIAQLLGTTRSSACNTMNELRTLGFVENEHRRLETLCLTAKGRKAAGLTSASATSAAPAPAPVDRWTGAEMRELLDVPHRAVTLVRRALTTQWGPPLLDAIGSLVEESEAVPVARVVAPSAPRIARANPKTDRSDDLEVEIDDDPPPRAKPSRPKPDRGGPYRVLDGDEETLGEFRTKAEAIDWLESDDQADTVLDGNGKVVGRKTGETENDDEEV